MITFKRPNPYQMLLRLIPAYRRRQDAKLREAVAQLMADPSLPCVIEGKLIPNGYGSTAPDRSPSH